MQPCNTGDQPYSDASPNGECSLVDLIILSQSDYKYSKITVNAQSRDNLNGVGM